MDMFQNCNTLLTTSSLNVRISRGLEQFHRMDLAKGALVTSVAKDDWSRAVSQPFLNRSCDETGGVSTIFGRGTVQKRVRNGYSNG